MSSMRNLQRNCCVCQRQLCDNCNPGRGRNAHTHERAWVCSICIEVHGAIIDNYLPPSLRLLDTLSGGHMRMPTYGVARHLTRPAKDAVKEDNRLAAALLHCDDEWMDHRTGEVFYKMTFLNENYFADAPAMPAGYKTSRTLVHGGVYPVEVFGELGTDRYTPYFLLDLHEPRTARYYRAPLPGTLRCSGAAPPSPPVADHSSVVEGQDERTVPSPRGRPGGSDDAANASILALAAWDLAAAARTRASERAGTASGDDNMDFWYEVGQAADIAAAAAAVDGFSNASSGGGYVSSP
jgi:hypothetical protein